MFEFVFSSVFIIDSCAGKYLKGRRPLRARSDQRSGSDGQGFQRKRPHETRFQDGSCVNFEVDNLEFTPLHFNFYAVDPAAGHLQRSNIDWGEFLRFRLDRFIS